MDFAAEDEVVLGGGDVGEGVVGVDGSPVFEGGAVVCVGVEGSGGGAGGEVEPLAVAAVEVLRGLVLGVLEKWMGLEVGTYPEISGAGNDFVASCNG